jgi:hypothetical protein
MKLGVAAPNPSPVSRRHPRRAPYVPTAAVPSVQPAKMAVAIISMRLRPKRSPSALNVSAPMRNPTCEALNTSPNALSLIPICAVIALAAGPSDCVSKPSRKATSEHSMTTRRRMADASISLGAGRGATVGCCGRRMLITMGLASRAGPNT